MGGQSTHDPYVLHVGARDIFVDLGAERLIAAEKGDQRIAVEVKSFGRDSEVYDLHSAYSQFLFYWRALRHIEPERVLYLAVTQEAWNGIFAEPVGALVREDENLRVIVFAVKEEVITLWPV